MYPTRTSELPNATKLGSVLMKKRAYLSMLLVLGLLIPVAFPSYAQENPADLVEDIGRDRLAQTGMKFLSVSLDARAAAVADAVTALSGRSLSMFYNPAGMGLMESEVHAALGQVQWIAEMNFNYASVAFQPLSGRLGVFGLTLVAADYGEFTETIRFDNDKGYQVLGSYEPTALAVGLGYARSLTDRFAVGGNVKYARESLGSAVTSVGEDGSLERGDYAESTVAFDFGVLYRTGFRSLNFAMSVRNLASEVTYYEENFELPLTFRVGVSMDMVDFTSFDQNTHALLLSVDAQRPRDYSEQINAGIEYRFLDVLALRTGYTYPTDEQGISLGAGVHTGLAGADFSFDYAYTQFGLFGNVNRLSLQVGM